MFSGANYFEYSLLEFVAMIVLMFFFLEFLSCCSFYGKYLLAGY
jgi:hypothetical protein